MKYRAEITTELKPGMLDPEGATIQRALAHLGYNVTSVGTAKKLLIELEADGIDDAREMLDEMCKKMLANPVIHNYSIEVQ
ncbi:MAG: phosphoribosylformylglycinamidine synthase subunit PurS [Euryarchaeota archaeon]|uniref:Phosphoribosylformylglycinamidine synthase subunit PurS n=1 Tax=Candidatus Methanogaster sp. ANME-2c ERB4 TaxID=2759911 RepID=A0A7G9YCS1_9EURY|nr:phosphoribosylformylglycinamidine synthase subunit PurS [Euryarchaeota archaeon]QNO44342.1 phosphoribosylformylglycinamidine synthase subunit PurS [Methanosarcinales archaeon ANME-2c ERB4]QNO45805.1 phosphoribosylformylglycinamidine synthase subunit PurS [Methanosarcinales archaeon ANME-2c ERB4]